MNILDKILMGSIFLMIGLLVIILVLFTFSAIDSVWLDKNSGTGLVIEKTHANARTTTTMVMVGKVLVPQTIRSPEKWNLVVSIDSDTSSLSVEKFKWDLTQLKDSVDVNYSRGRFSNKLYLK